MGFLRGGRRHAPRRRRAASSSALCAGGYPPPLVPSLGPNLCRTTRVIRPAWRGMAHLVSALRVSKGSPIGGERAAATRRYARQCSSRSPARKECWHAPCTQSSGGRVADLHGVATRDTVLYITRVLAGPGGVPAASSGATPTLLPSMALAGHGGGGIGRALHTRGCEVCLWARGDDMARELLKSALLE